LSKTSHTFLLYSIYLAFVIGDILTIWNPEYKGTFYLLDMPIRDIALIVMLIYFFINWKMIFRLVSKKFIFLYVAIIICFTLQGIIISGFSGWTRADLRFFLWFLGGISFGSVLIRTGEIRGHLIIIAGLTAGLVLAAALFGEEFQLARSTLITEYGRVSEPGIYTFGVLLYPPLILLFNMRDDSWQSHIISVLCIGILCFTGVYLANARSIGIIFVVILFLYVLSFGMQNNGIIINRIRMGKYLCIAMVVGIIGAYLFTYALSIDTRLERVLNVSATALGTDTRYIEAISFYEQGINDDTIVFGKGLGGTIISPTFDWDETGAIHIGMLNFWMKMGLIPFILISIYIFIILPILYFISLIKRASFSNYRTANLIVIPALFPWIMNLAISGGFTPPDSIFVGVACVIYGEISINGLRRILSLSPTGRH
jgi:hypothetical protein